MAEEKQHQGAPIEWTEELKEAAITHIIDEITEGKSIRAILREAKIKLPSNRLFLKWVAEDESLSKQYAYSMGLRADLMFEDMLDIADSVEDDLIILPDGREVVNNNVIQRDKLRVDTRKWALSRMNPKKYGEKVDLSSSDGSMTPKVLDLAQLSTEELLLRANATNKLKEK